MNTPIDQEKIKAFCARWKIREFSIFGSALRDDFKPDSDVDVLVSFSEEARWTLFDLSRMQDELKQIFGREVDLVSRRGLESSANHLRRQVILESAQVIYAA
jgi:hypothetical protein